jgi:hypothetical protein
MISEIKSGVEKRPLRRPTAGASLIACTLLVAGKLCLAGPASSQTTFKSPDEASRALVSALQRHDEPAVTEILGGGSELSASDDEGVDTLERERFVQKYQQMHRWAREPDGVRTLYIGAENWPFPIPLVSHNGAWRFDSRGGAEEIRFRRIGENEVTAIGMCDTLVKAETHPGTDSEADRLVKTRLPNVEETRKPLLFHGYYFHILSKGKGFAAIAYPAMYRSSGVMTFVVTQDGSVLEKNLGPTTANIAGAMTRFHPDATWTSAASARGVSATLPPVLNDPGTAR